MKNLKFKVYLASNDITVKDFAQKLGCHRIHLSQILNGKILAGRRLAKDVRELTNGEIELPTRFTINTEQSEPDKEVTDKTQI